jgi:thiamine biosynthesis lipoprotein
MKKPFFILIILSFLFSFSCREKKAPVVEGFNGFAQGTTYSVLYVDEKNFDPEDLKSKVEKILHEFDMSLSLYIDSSLLCRVNRNEDVILDDFFIESFKKSMEISALSDGAFDITVGPLVEAWGFGPDERKNFTESKRDSLLRLVGMDKVRLDGRRLVKSDPAIQLDFNAIAQGYSVDIISKYLDDLGIKNHLVDIGGEVRGKGTKLGADWRIGIDKPVDNNFTSGENLEAVIMISDESLATSGNYRKFYIENGVKYSHTIDPKTGYPAKNNLLSATILASDCATADGIATACMVIGTEPSKKFIESHPSYLAYLIYSDEKGNFRTWASPALLERINELNPN